MSSLTILTLTDFQLLLVVLCNASKVLISCLSSIEKIPQHLINFFHFEYDKKNINGLLRLIKSNKNIKIINILKSVVHYLLTGNICRSPIAEAVMKQALEREKLHHEWTVDSAGLGGWHSGSLPDGRALSVLKQNGIVYSNRARIITADDFKECDYIFGMDNNNVAELNRLAPQNSKAKVELLGDFGLEESNKIIEDPYYVSKKTRKKHLLIFSKIMCYVIVFSLWGKNPSLRYTTNAYWHVKHLQNV